MVYIVMSKMVIVCIGLACSVMACIVLVYTLAAYIGLA